MSPIVWFVYIAVFKTIVNILIIKIFGHNDYRQFLFNKSCRLLGRMCIEPKQSEIAYNMQCHLYPILG